jgi:hypothetical protein
MEPNREQGGHEGFSLGKDVDVIQDKEKSVDIRRCDPKGLIINWWDGEGRPWDRVRGVAQVVLQLIMLHAKDMGDST